MSKSTGGHHPSKGHSHDPELEVLLRELVQDWTSGTPRPLRDYLGRRPGLIGRPEVIVELINQEIVLRQMRGETPRPEDYLAEFPELTESLERLFEVHALGSGTLDPVDGTMIRSPMGGSVVPRPSGGRVPEIPGYEIERFLGRGGMGIVYLARQLGLNRRVALKLLQESRQDDPGLVARFRREAEAAARCQHPNLVQIHEIGEHAGELYLALEYVAGGHLGRALAGEPQPPRKAAELVETLARAIDHAHARDVVHRDLKPANVLLTQDGQPKITDFGLAKLKDHSTDTEVGTMVGTLAYMSPEQVHARSGNIGPRTDIHALGAILYEALTGRPPYRAETPQQVIHAILSEDVVPPSTRKPDIARDLEAICLKCLEKEPSRRYATAADLAEDLRRFLEGRPTAARPASAAERCIRWCRRNRAAVAAIAALLLLTTVSAWQAVRATMAERTAQTERGRATTEAEISRVVNAFLSEDILGQDSYERQLHDDVWGPNDLKVRRALDLASDRIGERFRGQARVEAAIRLTIGEAYRRIDLNDQARPHLDRAIDLCSRQLGPYDPSTLIAKCRLGLLLLENEPKPAEAEPLLVPALEGLLASRGSADPETLVATMGVGMLHAAKGDVARGRELLSRAVEGLRIVRGPAHRDTLDAVKRLATVLQDQGQVEEARHLQRESIRLLDEPAGKESRSALDAKFRLAAGFLGPTDYSGSIPHLEELLPLQRRVLGDGHHNTLLTITMLAHCYLNTKRENQAEPLMLEALPECRKAFERNHDLTTLVLGDLAHYYAVKGDIAELRQYLPEAVDMARALHGQEDTVMASGDLAIASLYVTTWELAAERYLRAYLAHPVQHTPDPDVRSIGEGYLGLCLLYRKVQPEGEKKLQLAYDWIAPRVHELEPRKLDAFRVFVTKVIQFYEDAGNKDRAATWKALLMDFDFPAETMAPKP